MEDDAILNASYYIGKFDRDADCDLQDSDRMSLSNAKLLIDSKRKNEDGDFTILSALDY